MTAAANDITCDTSIAALQKHLLFKSTEPDTSGLAAKITCFVQERATSRSGEFTMCPGGHTTLYASSFAAMTLHYIGLLEKVPASTKSAWIEYLQGWQDPGTGLFIGPELAPDEMTLSHIDWEYHAMHLTAHVLPALHTLGGGANYPLTFAQRFLDLKYLKAWLVRRDWRDAWREGNNLLFVGQLLVHLREVEQHPEANKALEFYFDWLDTIQDPETGVWGTQDGCPLSYGVYGAYHQLLVYAYCNRPIQFRERIIDSVLSLQHPDGGFEPGGGGGACQDVDCADILVKLSQQIDYRIEDSREALRRLLTSVISKMTPDGGFVYRYGESFMHHGLLRTYTPPNVPDLFSTWFRTHTLALIAQIVDSVSLGNVHWRFNGVCSMGWHDPTRSPLGIASGAQPPSYVPQAKAVLANRPKYSLHEQLRSLLIGRPLRFILARIPRKWATRFIVEFFERYTSRRSPEEALRFLLNVDEVMTPLIERYALDYTGQLLPTGWPARCHHEFFVEHLNPGETVLHIGCETGGLTYAIAVLTGVKIVGCDSNPDLIAIAKHRYHHPQLTYVSGDPLYELTDFHSNVILVDEASEKTPGNPIYLKQLWEALKPTRILMRLPRSALTWQASLRKQITAKEQKETPKTSDMVTAHFLNRLSECGLCVTSSQIRWGETWIEIT